MARTKREAHPKIHIDDLHPKNDGFIHSYKASWQETGVIVTLWLDVVDRNNWQLVHYRPGAYELTWHFGTVSGRPLGAIQEETAFLILRELRPKMLAAMTDAGWQRVDTTRQGQPIYHYRPAPRLTLVPAPQPAIEGTRIESEGDLPDIDLAGAGAGILGEDQMQGMERKGELANQDQVQQVELADQDDQPEPRQSHIVEVIGSEEAKERGQQPAYSREVFTRPVTFTCIVCKTTVTQQRYPGHIPLYCGDGCKRERQRENTHERVARHREKKKAAAATSASQVSSPSS